LVVTFLSLGLGAPIPTYTATTALNLKTSVNIVTPTSCAITASDMNFGTMSQVLGTETATSTVDVHCPTGTFFILSFSTTALATTKNSTLVNAANNKINFSMALASFFGFTAGTTTITGTLANTPNVPQGIYKSVETINVIY
jgi:hypothetical protein